MRKIILIMILLCGLLFCLSSCDKIGDDESDGENGKDVPIKPTPPERVYICFPEMSNRSNTLMG